MRHMPVAGGTRRETIANDRALYISLPTAHADAVGALLMDSLGPYEERSDRIGRSTLIFFPDCHGSPHATESTVSALLPAEGELSDDVVVKWRRVSRDWEEGWRDHFRPLVVGEVYVRPPWAEPAPFNLHDVMINPGLAFGTGLHPTTKGVLALLQRRSGFTDTESVGGPLVDVGTGSGILAIAAVRLGYGPVTAFDIDPMAVETAESNATANGVSFEVYGVDLAEAPVSIFRDSVVLANLTEGAVLQLLGRFASGEAAPVRPRRLLLAGILVGPQEQRVRAVGAAAGFSVVDSYHEGEWVSLELWPAGS